MSAFTSFAEYRECIYRQANAGSAHWDLSEFEIDKTERFVSEWLEICSWTETMYPITIRGVDGPWDNYPYIYIEIAVNEKRRTCYYIINPLSEEEGDTALSCWLKISFLFKMSRDLDEEDDAMFAAKCDFCDAWAILQYIHKETRDLDFGALSSAEYPLKPSVDHYDSVNSIMDIATTVWRTGTKMRQIARESNGLFTLILSDK